ncbi:hypothetical protein [Frankia sp. Cr2]|uniref:hypothetical protein n=1 Tax=Frankia sp. Cr2 TaxID=3073932 RepID=UPI002AD239D0|nr:hypothetical protein [Frankia sp. Cr2]
MAHLPATNPKVNAVWMWAAILAGCLLTLLQSLTGLDQRRGRAHGDWLRHEVLTVPGRVVRHARGLHVRRAAATLQGDRHSSGMAADTTSHCDGQCIKWVFGRYCCYERVAPRAGEVGDRRAGQRRQGTLQERCH